MRSSRVRACVVMQRWSGKVRRGKDFFFHPFYRLFFTTFFSIGPSRTVHRLVRMPLPRALGVQGAATVARRARAEDGARARALNAHARRKWCLAVRKLVASSGSRKHHSDTPAFASPDASESKPRS